VADCIEMGNISVFIDDVLRVEMSARLRKASAGMRCVCVGWGGGGGGRERGRERERLPLNKSESLAGLRAAGKLGSSIIAEKRP